MTLRRPIISTVTVETTATATTTSQWYGLDYKYDTNQDRAFFLQQGANGTLTLQVGASAPDDSGNVDTFYNVSSYTDASADGVLTGNWPSIRLIHVDAGPAQDSTFVIMA